MKIKKRKRLATNKDFFHTHVHSKFSSLDATSSVDGLVERAARLRMPAMGLTDHGNMAGSVQLYKAGKKHGVQIFPGTEGYLVESVAPVGKGQKQPQRYHIGLLALNLEGYRELVALTSLSHRRENFNRFPRFDLNHLAEMAGTENIAVLTGCVSGLPIQTLMQQGYDAAKRVIEMYARWFPNTFVEVQNHGNEWGPIEENPWAHGDDILTDADITFDLYDMAQELGLPVIVSQDAHYTFSKEREAHDLMKRMVFGGENSEFNGDSFHLASTDWVEEHHADEVWQAGLEGARTLLSKNEVVFPALEKFQAQIPNLKKNPLRYITRRAVKQLDFLENNGLLIRPRKFYDKRLDHELDIIGFLKYDPYFTSWCMLLDYCDEEEIAVEVRGSGNSSLLNYLLGISSLDPLRMGLSKNGLLFERFMSKDRKKPPDIDLDVEDKRRGDILEFLSRTFDVVQIGTFAALGSRDEDDKGSVLVSYNSYLRKKIGNPAQFNAMHGKGVETIRDVKDISEKDYRGLRLLAEAKPYRSYGVHAAAVLLSGNEQKISDYVPTMLVASSGTTVSQFMMDDVEELGYIKKDILGQRTLTTMRRCQELMGREKPRDFSWIPWDDKETMKLIREGVPENGVFQFEGWSMAKGARQLKPKTTMDCVLAGALFRPAIMETGMTDLYIERRHNPSLRKGITYPHPAFEEVLKPTYGIVLFQEQVLEIMRKLGLDYEGINTFFKIVKDSGRGATERNVERMAEVVDRWNEICKNAGIEDPDEAWHYIEGYTKYGFNEAHSAGYGLRSYRVAYLKVHFPLEFHAALLESWAGKAKEPIYIKEARRMGVRLLAPDVNVSGPSWTIDPNKRAVRKGLSSIKKVGAGSAESIHKNAPYESIEELIEKNPGRACTGGPKYLKEGEFTGVLLALKEAGALSSLGISRDE